MSNVRDTGGPTQRTYRELLLELENATKRESNVNDWPTNVLLGKLKTIDHIREILKDHLDRAPIK